MVYYNRFWLLRHPTKKNMNLRVSKHKTACAFWNLYPCYFGRRGRVILVLGTSEEFDFQE